ncbi:MAG: hypothetical protein LUD76_01940 [Alistipes sp.]|nr:hypothetical protein [Alistipes sp.]MCD8172213.1 hypothetical protein [Alistipes sp.]
MEKKKLKRTPIGDYSGRQYNGDRPDNGGRYQSDYQNWNREKPVLQNERSHPDTDRIAEKKNSGK